MTAENMTITGFAPADGASGSTQLRIQGEGLEEVTRVTFHDSRGGIYDGVNVEVQNPNVVRCIVPTMALYGTFRLSCWAPLGGDFRVVSAPGKFVRTGAALR